MAEPSHAARVLTRSSDVHDGQGISPRGVGIRVRLPCHPGGILMDRAASLRGASGRSTKILEIGAGYSPIAPKSEGWNTHVTDHCDAGELRAKYASLGLNVDAIEPVDTIWRDGALHNAVPAPLHGKFQRVIASHVIEHIPDIAGFLFSLERLVHADGIVALAIPDRRFCFDYFKPHSTTGDVLEAHAAKRTRHSRRTAWNHVAYAVNMDGTGAWGQHPVHRPTFMGSFGAAVAAQREFRDDVDAPYVDNHAWHFTPSGFALTILELGQLGITDWRIDTLHGNEGCEFLVFLRRGADRIAGSALQDRRMTLLREQLTELHEQLGFALAGGLLPPALSDPEARKPDACEEIQRPMVFNEVIASIVNVERKIDAVAASAYRVEILLGHIMSGLAPIGAILRPIRAGLRRLQRRPNPAARSPIEADPDSGS
jgi:hypothetical protein